MLKERIRKAIEKVGEKRKRKKERRWWDEECREKVKKEMKRWRREGEKI